MKRLKTLFSLVVLGSIMTGCAVAPQQNRDLSVYQNNIPKSILILPPINESPDAKATYGFWSTVTVPVAEAGYYVFPISVVNSMLQENGVNNGYDAQSISINKLNEIFGADAALYIKVKEYGSQYQVIQSKAQVSADAKLVDLKTGETLWTGSQSLTQASDSSGGLLGAIVNSIVDQISNQLSDKSYVLSQSVSSMLFTPQLSQQKGLLYGPRSPDYTKNSMKPDQ